MLNLLSIEEIDRLLDELEQLAHTDSSRPRFFDAALERLQFLLAARGAALFFRAADKQWFPTAKRGTLPLESIPDLLAQATGVEEYLCSADSLTLAVPIRRSQWTHGVLAIEFNEPASSTEVHECVKLCQAFGEILTIRQASELDTLFSEKLPNLQRTIGLMQTSGSIEEGAYLVVNELTSLFQADRAALFQAQGASRCRMLAISGVVQPQPKAASVVALESLGLQAIQQGQLITQQHHPNEPPAPETDEQLILPNYVCVPFPSRSPPAETLDCALLLEWQEYERFVAGVPWLHSLLPPLVLGWQQLERWLRIPRPIRSLSRFRSPAIGHRLGGAMLRWAAIIGLVALFLWGVNRPATLRIEAEGTLQPIKKRAVFAPMDGVVARLLVVNGQQIAAGDPLIEMNSPLLAIELEEVLGEIRANGEKRDGLAVTINQLANTDTDLALQGKISSEIRELETRLNTLEEKRAALLAEKEKLLIKSPISGTVVARQIKQTLDSRPVRRGDPLLRVVDLDGPWQLELLIADGDSGYLRQKLFEASEAGAGIVEDGEHQQIDFVIASQPESEWGARVTWMSESARNPRGEGVFVDLRADVDSPISSQAHMGATVYAYFDCGSKPFWFVWSRPFVEAIQRKLWF